jgi:hypothetical protein
MVGKEGSERIDKLEFLLLALDEKMGKRLDVLERRLELENYALVGLRWMGAVAGGAVIIALVNGWLA